MKKRFYFNGMHEDGYTAEEAASMLMDDGTLIKEWLNDDFLALYIIRRLNSRPSTGSVQKDLEELVLEILTNLIETNEKFRKRYEIECGEE